MNLPVMITSGLIALGAALLVVSLYPTTRILRELAPGPMQTRWRVLRWFIVFFIVGYLVCLGNFTVRPSPSQVLVSLIFFLGGCFVLLVCELANGTVRDIKRIAVLEAETITDPLMGIFNRRYLERRLEEEFARARRYGFPLSLLLLDIDHFKKVNDECGHRAGDQVLKEIGAILKNSVRNVDVLARYGGEEVVILLPHTCDADAVILAERLRRVVENHPFGAVVPSGPAMPLRCTVSIGVASMTPECAGPLKLLEMADSAMYRAKRDGRNRVCVLYCGREPAGTGGPAA